MRAIIEFARMAGSNSGLLQFSLRNDFQQASVNVVYCAFGVDRS